MCDHCGCRAFGPIAELTADHEHILERAWAMVEGEWADEASHEAARAELNRFLDLHAVKEEIGLYPLLISTGDLDQERCDGLEAEHRYIHGLLDRAAFDRRAYFALAAHIEEEEMELFSASRFAFGDEEWEAMDQAHHAAAHEFGVPHDHGEGSTAPPENHPDHDHDDGDHGDDVDPHHDVDLGGGHRDITAVEEGR